MEKEKIKLDSNTQGVIASLSCFIILSLSYFLLIGQDLTIHKKETSKPTPIRINKIDSNDLQDASTPNIEEATPVVATHSIPGLYPEASERLLTNDDLIGLSKEQLRIMRNEIFARHGYIFKTAAMKNHFEQQPWYDGTSTDVTHLLTSIEHQNIALIQQYE